MKGKLSKNLLGIVLGLVALAIVPWAVQAGSLEPSGPPGPTTQIPPAWSQKLPGSERFELVLDGAGVLDKETGLVWEQSPDTNTRTWTPAIPHCYKREVGGRKGWRLPTVEELASLVDTSVAVPLKLPDGHPFTNVQSDLYWSITSDDLTFSLGPRGTSAWRVSFLSGFAGGNTKSNNYYAWCVRGGHGVDAHQ